jgi:hypothetical protein
MVMKAEPKKSRGLRTRQAVQRSGYSFNTIRDAVWREKISAVKINGDWFIDEASLEKWMESSERKRRPQALAEGNGDDAR